VFGLRDDDDLVVFCLEGTMMEHERSDPHFDAVTARLLRRAANELNTTSGPGLESVLARISAEVTAEAAGRTPPLSHRYWWKQSACAETNPYVSGRDGLQFGPTPGQGQIT
jgi:hypothetical protein